MANIGVVLKPPPRVDFEDALRGLCSLPRGSITEILGDRSTGRTALAQSMLATATLAGEVAAWIDGHDSFDPASAARAGADLGKLLWVQCAHSMETAVKAADMVLHSGGFGLIVLDLCDVPSIALQRIPLSYWYRLRRAVEHTPTILLILGRQSVARSSSHQLAMTRSMLEWRGLPPFQTIVRMESEAVSKKPFEAPPIKLDVLAEA
jgi:recombination protein RecA